MTLAHTNSKKPIYLDLGAGTKKMSGFIGTDRFLLEDIDLVHDLDQSFPFADDTVDLIVASHSLEHVDNLISTMKEIYRICKHGAQLCIVAPYFHQSLNLANPYHKQTFNEHTPRFWTNSTFTLVKPEEYSHPHAEKWGLASSDHSDPYIDFRCARIEFFYFPKYQYLSNDEQREARQKYIDVCDQIMYHLIIVKRSISDEEFQRIAETMNYYVPEAVVQRQNAEHTEKITLELHVTEAQLSDVQSQLANLEGEIEHRIAKIEELQAELEYRDTRISLLESEVQAYLNSKEQLDTEILSYKSSIVTLQSQVIYLQKQIEIASQNLTKFKSRLGLPYIIASKLYARVSYLRTTHNDLWPSVAPSFQQLKDDSILFILRGAAGFRLGLSEDLTQVPFISYSVPVLKLRLSAISFAIDFQSRMDAGSLGVEIVLNSNIIAQSIVEISNLLPNTPIKFDFPSAIPSDENPLEVRIFSRNIPGQVRLYELKRYRMGIGRLERQLFCGFHFS